MSKQTPFVPMEKTLLVKEISQIGKIGNKLNLRIQIAAMNAVYYSVTEGYIQYGQNLVLAMNAGQRKNSLVAFLEKFGNFAWSKENKNLIYQKNDKATVESLDAIDERWFETIKVPEPKSMYDFEEDVSKFIKRMEKAVTDKATIVHIELMDYIKAAVDQFHADQVAVEEGEDEIFGEDELAETALLMQALNDTGEEVEASRQPIRRAA